MVVSPIVYAELLASPAITPPFLEHFFSNTGVSVDYDMDATLWKEAGTRYARYAARRRRATGKNPRRLIADFVIGAHALARADRLLTLDTRVYAQDFPDLRLHPASSRHPASQMHDGLQDRDKSRGHLVTSVERSSERSPGPGAAGSSTAALEARPPWRIFR